MDRDIRTVVNFYKNVPDFNQPISVRTVQLTKVLPNAAVGQTMSFDHPQLSKSFSGTIYNIQQVIYLSEKTDPPMTYIDVMIDS